jgi:hypothetical protein
MTFPLPTTLRSRVCVVLIFEELDLSYAHGENELEAGHARSSLEP